MPARRVSSEPFFSVDAAWLHMNCPANTVTIIGLSLFDTPLDYDQLRLAIEQRLLPQYPRFRQRVREPRRLFALPVWEPDRHFRLEHHLNYVQLPAPGDWPALQAFLERLNREPLDPERPLWDMWLAGGYGRGSALVMRLSHAVADGAALMHVMDTFCPTTVEASLAPLEPPAEAPRRPRRGLVTQLDHTLQRLEAALAASRQAVHTGLEAAAHPRQMAQLGASGALALGKLLFIPPDRATMLKGKCGPAKQLIASRPVPLAELKAMARALDCKINDLLMAAVSGGLRRYLQAHEQEVRGLNIRATVPVYLGQWDKAQELRNGFGLAFMSLPVGIHDPLRCLLAVKARMDAIKETPEAAVAYGILFGMGYTPPAVDRLIARIFGMKATAVLTNVAGPREPRYLAGVAMQRLMFWVPTPAGMAIGVSLMSYNGEVIVTLNADSAVMPEAALAIDGFHAELEHLRRRAFKLAPATAAERVRKAAVAKQARAERKQPAKRARVAARPAPVKTAQRRQPAETPAPVPVPPAAAEPPRKAAPKAARKTAKALKPAAGLTKPRAPARRRAPAPSAQPAAALLVTLPLAAPDESTPLPGGNGHQPTRCQAQTQSGAQCRKHALPGQTVCAVHARQVEPA